MEEILENPGEDRPGREGSRVAIGQTASGRYLRLSTSGNRIRTVRSLSPHTSFAVSRFWRIVGGRGEGIDEAKPVSLRLE